MYVSGKTIEKVREDKDLVYSSLEVNPNCEIEKAFDITIKFPNPPYINQGDEVVLKFTWVPEKIPPKGSQLKFFYE